MKQFKFLSNYTQIFEGVQENKKIVDKLLEMLKDSSAMNDIVALREDFPKGQAAAIHEEPRGAKAIGPERAYQITKSDSKFMISFKSNFGRHADIELEPNYITIDQEGNFVIDENATFLFKTSEQSASAFGDEEQKKAADSFFRFLNKEDIKHKYHNISIPTDIAGVGDVWRYDLTDKGGTRGMSSIRRITNFADKWNEKYGSFAETYIDIPESPNFEDSNEVKNSWRDEMLKRLNDFKLAYNAKITPIRDAAVSSGEKKVISVKHSTFPVIMTFDNLEECLRWIWAYFVARKTSRRLDAGKTFDYLMNERKDLWGKRLPIGDRYVREEKGLTGRFSEDEEFMKRAGLRAIVGTEIMDIENVVDFVIRLYKSIGLTITPIIGTWASVGVSKGAKRIDEFPTKTKETGEKIPSVPDATTQYIMGFEISNDLTQTNSILSAAAKLFTESVVQYMDTDLIFELSPRSEFKYTDSKKITTRVDADMVRIYFECRTEEEAFRKLLTGFKDKDETGKEIMVNPFILQAFSARQKVKTSGKEIEKAFFLSIITNYTKYLKDNMAKFVPSIATKSFSVNNLPAIATDDSKILDAIVATLKTPAISAKSDDIKRSLKEINMPLYTKLVSADMTEPTEKKEVEPKTTKSAVKDILAKRKKTPPPTE